MTTQEHLTSDFDEELKAHSGLIPISINPDKNEITWMDLEKYHFYEGFFHKSLSFFTALKKGNTYTTTSPLAVLKNDDLFTGSLYPTGFIFHVGRCGSTLLAKVLARSSENLVLSEPEPLNSVLNVFTKNGLQPIEKYENNQNIYKNLILALGRRRNPLHKNFFIKFTSYNIHLFHYIHAIFPDVPAIFITRDLDEVVNSFEGNIPPWLKSPHHQFIKSITGNESVKLRTVIEGFLQKAAQQNPSELKTIDYKTLRAENLQDLLDLFNVVPHPAHIDAMKAEFLFNSKQELRRKLFDKNK